jgi:exodeoxyribonuclease-3
MRILAWNIRHGGGTRRADQIVEAIVSHDPDIIALTEFRRTPGIRICEALGRKGWRHVKSTDPNRSENGICVLSRVAIQSVDDSPVPAENAVRWLDIYLTEQAFGLTVVNILGSGAGVISGEKRGAAKSRFWDALLAACATRVGESFLLLGDFNTGLHGMDEAGRTFYCAEHFALLSALGWADVWRQFHGQKIEFTWYSILKGGLPVFALRA